MRRSPFWYDARLCRSFMRRMCLSSRLAKHSRLCGIRRLLNSGLWRVSWRSSSALGVAWERARSCYPCLRNRLGNLPRESRHQRHLSAAFGNVIDICHPIISRLASQHLDRPPCLSRHTKRAQRISDVRRHQRGAASNARPEGLGNIVPGPTIMLKTSY